VVPDEVQNDTVHEVLHSNESVKAVLQLISAKCSSCESAMRRWMPAFLPGINVF
jgi:hypothetical protein